MYLKRTLALLILILCLGLYACMSSAQEAQDSTSLPTSQAASPLPDSPSEPSQASPLPDNPTLVPTQTQLPTTTVQPPTATDQPTPTPLPTIGAGSVLLAIRDLRPMVFVPGGTFLMGAAYSDTNADDDERPQHEVLLDGFWIDQFEVTHLEYELCVQSGACDAPAKTDTNGFSYAFARAIADAPVVNLTWNDAVDYCAWAGKRLPTEAEWEKAARGTDARVFPWGDTAEAFGKAWFCEGCVFDADNPKLQDDFSRPASAGSFPEGASPYGAQDMAGNVWEWVSDLYASNTYSQPNRVNPTGAETGTYRVVRGGSWTTPLMQLR
ncbi:MAG: SUMF1/EgtB/PvdO family nonheme iron enzyme, partial [Anaerolineales bacterium]|nr:SUMF1/EgtB/PvdO family nonheme iron enzyme [Anaerolineales bacterium]